MRILFIAAALVASTPVFASSPAPVSTERAHAEAAAVAAERTARDFYFMVAMTTPGREGTAAAKAYLQIAKRHQPAKPIKLATR